MKILKFNTRKKKCFSVLTILLVSLITPFILILCIDYGHSWQNSQMRDNWSPPSAYTHESQVDYYVFKSSAYALTRDGSKMHYNHGVHDWIADSALRIIRLDPLYPKRLTSWILDDFIPYGEFDDYPNTGKGFSVSRGWYSVQTKYGSKGDDRNWMRNRRYARFLHGTGFPDWRHKTAINIKNTPIPFEACHHTASWMSNLGHHFRFKPDGSIDFSSTPAGEYAIQAAQSAIHWLSYKKTVIHHGEEYTIRGKWEAGAQCLGGMTHFIADVAHPFHTTIGKPNHLGWDKIGDTLVGWNDQGGFSMNGGPDWSKVNPSLYSVALIPIDPWTAVKEMATFAHDYNGDNFAINLPEVVTPSDPLYYLKYLPWVKQLLNKAVWYTACAMLWVLLQCDIHDDTFSDRWENGQPIGKTWSSYMGRFKAKMYSPQDIKTIRESINAVEEGKAEWYNPGIHGLGLANLVYFAPLLIISIPSLIPAYLLYWWEEKKAMH